MTSITSDELLERLHEVLARVRDGEQFVVVYEETAVAGLLPVADLRASVAHPRRTEGSRPSDDAAERSTPPARASTKDEADLERLREELESRRT